ncbi:uncharacterized protein Eint_071030 [Encephalitozoon intestinalis ATCC 50506]|uniref:Uncharacterized protein n=1 Tax=Encephalitozoon intestinalis (strain ATCC 50506) TaxID=876142 RepID=E0S831_ENCIT|nr:uncharacterized protein Eint_071030 [Encephalitozoon intestinalis ATCC 50506]ADM11866.1 hypothetical protein Eint_071030 [Encephalitozoon intestinalis ATCC 50506]UTX45621.1 hypothetical protein GPK93_07g11860 [Encephalitozoon intestinalis]
MEFIFLLLLSGACGHIKNPVEIRLFLKPDLELKVGRIPLINTSIEEKEGKYAITIGNLYISGNDSVSIGDDEFYWNVYDRQLGTIICSEDQCLTYTEEGLEMSPCFDPSDFRSASQLFQIDSTTRVSKNSNGIRRKMDLVGKVEGLVDPVSTRIAEMVDDMDSFCTDSEEEERS